MAGADAGTVVAVEVLVKEDQIAPVRIVLIAAVLSVHGTAALFVLKEDAREPSRELSRDIPQREVLSRCGRILNFEIVAEVVMELLQRFDDEVVHREPDRPAPV